jgi:predicted transcriptional regulator
LEKEDIEKTLIRVIEMLELLLGKVEVVIKKLDRFETQVPKSEELAPTEFLELRSTLIKVLKGLAKTNRWTTPEELASVIGFKSSQSIRYRHLPELHRLGLVVRQSNPEEKLAGKRGYLYKLNIRGLPEHLKAIILESK